MFSYDGNSQNYTTVTIKTPNQTAFYADSLISGDYTSTQKNDAKNFWLNCYNNRITFIDEATHKYNCHAYAWHVSEGGSKVWIDTPGDDNYWEDCSYFETQYQSDATKVSFGGPCNQTWTTCSGTRYTNPCDHSAVTTGNSDYFISKWGPSPLFRHHKDDCPYSTEDLHYYVRVEISGPSTVCSSGATFTLSYPPPVDSIIWSTGPYLTVYSGQNTDSPVIKATGSGSSSVTARLVTDCGSITLPAKSVWAGVPNAPNNITRFPSNGKKFAIDSYYEFYVSPQQGATYFTWDVSGGTIVEGQGTSFVLVRTASYPTNFSLSVKSGNNCGESNYFTRTGYVVDEDLPIDAIPPDETSAEIDTPENNLIELKQGFIPVAYTISIAPNPATGETTLTIETNSSEKTFDENAPWDLEVYSETQLLKTKQTGLRGQSAKIQTAGWKEGIYLVRVKYNDEILTGKLVVKR